MEESHQFECESLCGHGEDFIIRPLLLRTKEYCNLNVSKTSFAKTGRSNDEFASQLLHVVAPALNLEFLKPRACRWHAFRSR